jgi:hypothetical protein
MVPSARVVGAAQLAPLGAAWFATTKNAVTTISDATTSRTARRPT